MRTTRTGSARSFGSFAARSAGSVSRSALAAARRTIGSGSASAFSSAGSVARPGWRTSRGIALARAIAGTAGSFTTAASAASAPGAPASPAANASAQVWNPGLRCGCQRATASAAHFAPSFAWQPVQAFGVPSATLRSGLGTRIEWSWRGSTTMYVVVGMWQAAHAEPGDPGAWRWCATASNRDGAWHWPHTALPGARSFCVWGSWQSEQLTPFACIRLCRNEPWT